MVLKNSLSGGCRQGSCVSPFLIIGPMSALTQRLYTAAAARELDRLAIEEHGIAGYELMCRAGQAVVDVAREAFPNRRTWLVLCGAGNNGGDGYVIARQARALGLEVNVAALCDPQQLRGDAGRAYQAWRESGGTVSDWQGSLPGRPGVIIDAMLGTGLDRPLAGDWRAAIELANAARVRRVAVDIPSGLHADTGTVLGAAFMADLTVTFIGRKRGLYTADGPDHAGLVEFADLDVPDAVHEALAVPGSVEAGRLLSRDDLRAGLPARRKNTHKGGFGHVLVLGGNRGMSGAARLTAEAALRCGAGLVSVATHRAHADMLNLARPELMVLGLDEQASLAAVLERASVLAVGPGMGKDSWARKHWTVAMASVLPLVLDADGLNLLAELGAQRPDMVLTPHPAEAARLLACSCAEVQADRVGAAQRLARQFQAVVVLKGVGTVVATPDGQWSICPLGNPGMATAGSGDVLTGVIAALLAQGLCSADAARLGVVAHAAAGDLAAGDGQRGTLALDICTALRAVVNN